jgi:hypothetical protein
MYENSLQPLVISSEMLQMLTLNYVHLYLCLYFVRFFMDGNAVMKLNTLYVIGRTRTALHHALIDHFDKMRNNGDL